jgi:hypothetical protein
VIKNESVEVKLSGLQARDIPISQSCACSSALVSSIYLALHLRIRGRRVQDAPKRGRRRGLLIYMRGRVGVNLALSAASSI